MDHTKDTHDKASEPLFSVVRFLLVESHINESTVFSCRCSKLDHMAL